MYCTNCGSEIPNNSNICTECGSFVGSGQNTGKRAGSSRSKNDTMKTLIKVFMVLGCIACGGLCLPLVWCIPMTVKTFRSLDAGKPLSTGFKVCSLIFVSIVAGILMLCMDDNPQITSGTDYYQY